MSSRSQVYIPDEWHLTHLSIQLKSTSTEKNNYLFGQMRRSTFIKHIKQIEEEELREELLTLYTQIPEVKAHYAMELGSDKDRQKVYEKAKASIISKYKTKSRRRPRRPRIQKINTLLKEMERSSVLPYEMIDLYLFNAEQGLSFMNAYKFYSDPLRNTILKSLEKALALIEDALFQDQYRDRMELLITIRIYDYFMQKEVVNMVRKVYPDE